MSVRDIRAHLAQLYGVEVSGDLAIRYAKRSAYYQAISMSPIGAADPNVIRVVNLLLGATVAALAGCNVAVAGHAAQLTACRWRGYGRLLGVLPAFLLGFACCMPVLLLALGTATGAALLPLLLPLRPVFYPLTLTLLVTALVWGTHGLASRQPTFPVPRSV